MKTADLVKETITIAQVGPYGVRVGEAWYGLNEPLAPSDFEKGKSYEVLVKKLTKKSYIAQILNDQIAAAPQPVREAPIATTTATWVTAPVIKTVNENKDRRILVQGITQAVVQSPALVGTANFVAEVEKVARELIAFVDAESR